MCGCLFCYLYELFFFSEIIIYLIVTQYTTITNATSMTYTPDSAVLKRTLQEKPLDLITQSFKRYQSIFDMINKSVRVK